MSLGRKSFVAEINVTPFVDVMLVLLIIFMVTAPLMTEGLEVELPETKVSALATDKDHIVLTITKSGKIKVGEYETALENLMPTLQLAAKEQKKQVFLQADANVPYGMVVDVMARINAAKIYNLALVARSPQTETQPGRPEGGAQRR